MFTGAGFMCFNEALCQHQAYTGIATGTTESQLLYQVPADQPLKRRGLLTHPALRSSNTL